MTHASNFHQNRSLVCQHLSHLSVYLSPGQVLGSGEFGRVVEATVSDLIHSDSTTKVAVKMVKRRYLSHSLFTCLSSVKSVLYHRLMVHSIITTNQRV